MGIRVPIGTPLKFVGGKFIHTSVLDPASLGATNRIQTRERCFMRERVLTIPEIMLIAGTRIALGAGIGLLLAEKLNHNTRKGAGWALLAVGALTTVPLVVDVVTKGQLPEKARQTA
jgi:hypothetical protein